jgi:hemerythrin-like domain-containing protein
MKVFLQELYDEHTMILSVFQKVEPIFLDSITWSHETWALFADFVQFCELYIEQNHHKKEEEILFPKIDLSPIVYQGGPYCTHFYHFHLMFQHYERSKELLTEAQLILDILPLSENVNSIIKNRSGLMVPLEEHWAGINLIRVFKDQLRLQKENQQSEEFLRKCISFYIGLILQHTDKENRCLFAMADNLLDESTQTELHRISQEKYKFDLKAIPAIFQKLKMN